MKKEKITIADIEHLAELSALSFTDDEKIVMVEQVSGIIEMLNACAEVEIKEQETTKSMSLQELRNDECGEMLNRESVFLNTPKCEQNYVVVPKVVE